MRLLLLSAAAVCVAAPAMAQDFPEPPPQMSGQDAPMRMGPPERETLAEMQARMGQMFDRLDADRDGVVTTAQLQAARGGRMLERADADGDGRLTRDEIDAAAQAMFTRMDANQDGVVTADERPRMRPGG